MKFHTFYTKNLPEQLLLDHQKICDKLELKVQYHIENAIDDYNTLYTAHGKFMTSVMQQEQVACFLDIDCIPHNKKIIQNSYDWAIKNKSFVGNAQNISHTQMRNRLYAAASFLIVTQDAWNTLGRPDLSWFIQDGIQIDTAQILSLRADEIGMPYQLMYPIGYDGDNHRMLGSYGNYGTGTLYPATWHYFRISEFKDNLPDLWSRRINNVFNQEQIIPNHLSCFYEL
jgi:hypothetical protein